MHLFSFYLICFFAGYREGKPDQGNSRLDTSPASGANHARPKSGSLDTNRARWDSVPQSRTMPVRDRQGEQILIGVSDKGSLLDKGKGGVPPFII